MRSEKMSKTDHHSPMRKSRRAWLLALGAALAVLAASAYVGAFAAIQEGPYDVTVAITDVDPNPVIQGLPVTITVSVVSNDPAGGIPTGEVEVKSEGNLVCHFDLDAAGQGHCTLTFSRVGVVPLEAVYAGVSPFLPGVSEPVNLVVNSPNQSFIIYQHDFETDVGAEWGCSYIHRDVTPSGRGFLGEFGNQTACLNLEYLPKHDQVSVVFDLYIIRSWNGNVVSAGGDAPSEPRAIIGPDVWSLKADGSTLLITTFANWLEHPQAYPGSYPGSSYLRRTGAVEINTLGYYASIYPMDTVYHLAFTFFHTADDLALDFKAQGLQPLMDESWGLDNILVSIQGGAQYKNYLPILIR
jgi:hypothetical protein